MPSAISRPREPVETTSMSIDLSFLPSRMIEPLPKLRSICESAASRAFDLSMDEPSTRRSAAAPALMIPCSLWPLICEPTTDAAPRAKRCERQPPKPGPAKGDEEHCTLFVLGSQYVLLTLWVLAG